MHSIDFVKKKLLFYEQHIIKFNALSETHRYIYTPLYKKIHIPNMI